MLMRVPGNESLLNGAIVSRIILNRGTGENMRWPIIILALAVASVSPSHAQSNNLAGAKAAVQACVEDVRDQAKRPENFQFGAAPTWKNFDAYIAPDGLIFNNARLNGEMDGVYRFNKCLAEHGFSIGGAPPAASPTPANPVATCTDEELAQRPGDCWVKLSRWEKHLYASAFVDGKVYSYGLAERQQYEWVGTDTITPFTVAEDKVIDYFDTLYRLPENRNVWFADAYDLVVRKTTNPETKDLPLLLAMYRKHHRPLFKGYLRGFVSPNKVIVSEYSDAPSSSETIKTFGNETYTAPPATLSSI